MIKRLLDIIVSVVMLICLLPLMLVMAIIISIKLGNPIIFSQKRPGLNGKTFRLYKFRSMTNSSDSDGVLLPDNKRLTAFGQLLRSTSIDELPSLLNVIKGDMSLVGPRPLLIEYLPLYSPEQAKRHDVKPGITGWAQVNGRNAINWEDKFKFDNYYAKHQSLYFDLKIILLTVKKVFIREGITERGQVSMSKFTGNKGFGEHSE